MSRSNWKKALGISAAIVGTGFIITSMVARKKRSESIFDNELNQKNPFEGKKVVFVENDSEEENADGVRGHLESIGESDCKETIYTKYIKRGLDVLLSFGGLVILSPVFMGISLAIKIDDPGPVLFTQKRVGKDKQYFKLHKFRSMKMCTPHDVPTHQLDNPDQYITKVGRFLRAHSLDELPQIWDIFIGNMSVIGPRPGLWNQDLLTAEREKYGANDVKPGLTGWAQINGRDELEIPVKAMLDGQYVKEQSFLFDLKCFVRTIRKIGRDDSVVEGGTGEIHREKKSDKKKILFLSNHFITLFSFRKELIKKLLDEGHEVFLSIPEDENNYFENLGCKIIITEIDRRGVDIKNDLKLLRFYKKMIPEIGPDIIFSYTIKPNIYGCLASNGKYKQVCNITGTGGTFLKNDIVARICRLLYRLSIRRCYKVYFQNTGDRDYFIDNNLVYNNYEMLPGSGCNLNEHEFEVMPPDEIVRFIFIGRVMELKGIDEYLEAAKFLRSKYTNVEFLIAGWNEEDKYQNIISQYQEKGFVTYIGFRDDIADWIKKCHCTVLPSHGGEGVPNVLLESAATGRACIGSRINGTKDVIEEGVTGYLFEKGDAKDLIKVMEQFINLPFDVKQKMGEEGRNKVQKEFDRNIVINKYCNEVLKA